MSDQEKSGLGFPPIAGIVLIITVIGAIWLQKPPLKGSRPTDYGAAINTLENAEDVRTRPWQDPFDVVHQHEHDDINARNKFHSHNSLATQITKEIKSRIAKENENKNNNSPIINVLGVMVGGGPYFENVENRRRRRYAVLSALEVSGYSPEDAQHIGYFETESINSNNKANISVLPDRIPYEWFKHVDSSDNPENDVNKPQLLLLWLDEDFFGSKPLGKINELLNKLNLTYSCYADKLAKVGFTVLGPSSSTTLRSMAKELRAEELRENDISKWKNLNNIKIQILSPVAIADDQLILRNLYNEEESIKVELIKELFENNISEGCFLRTIKSDFSLAECIKGELELRGVKPGDDHIVLISEWDTFYGRAIPLSFTKSFSLNGECDDYTVHKYSYLRGIDGQAPESISNDSILIEINNNKNINLKESEKDKNNISKNPPVGNSQFDYLQRLGRRIHNLNKMLIKRSKDKGIEKRIKAIGVLGSDDYDKLLILQALRKKFPDVIFFTTDLDARLSHSDELKWTRNLVVASNFDLQLHPAIQKHIPPFRDNYQTSVFFSALLALNSDPNKLKETKQSDIYKLIQPQIFEIGRHGPFKLRTINNNGKMKKVIESKDILKDLLGESFSPEKIPNSIHVVSQDIKIDENKLFTTFFRILFVAIFLFVIILTITKKKDFRLVFIISFLFTISIYTINKYNNNIIHLVNNILLIEPFSLTGGVSIWPAELIRIVAILCALYFLYRSWNDLNDSIGELKVEYFCEELPQREYKFILGILIFIIMLIPLKQVCIFALIVKKRQWLLFRLCSILRCRNLIPHKRISLNLFQRDMHFLLL